MASLAMSSRAPAMSESERSLLAARSENGPGLCVRLRPSWVHLADLSRFGSCWVAQVALAPDSRLHVAGGLQVAGVQEKKNLILSKNLRGCQLTRKAGASSARKLERRRACCLASHLEREPGCTWRQGMGQHVML